MGDKGNIQVDFHVNGMPLQVFKNFKEYSKDYRDNYSITIQVLMEKNEIMEKMLMNEGYDLEPEYEDTEETDKVETIGGE